MKNSVWVLGVLALVACTEQATLEPSTRGTLGGVSTADGNFDRALSEMEPHLTRSLTPAVAQTRFGRPDEVTGSGLLILKYRVDRGTLWLGFAGDAHIVYAYLEDARGLMTTLQLR